MNVSVNSEVTIIGSEEIGVGIVEGLHPDGIAVAFNIENLSKQQMRAFEAIPFLNKGAKRRIFIFPEGKISLAVKHGRLQKEARKGSRKKPVS